MEIISYYVGTNRQRDSTNYHRRWISLVPKTPTAEVRHIVIYFFVQETVTSDTDIGYTTPTSSRYVVGYAPVSDFVDMYAILQSEKPVYFNWYADGSGKLQWFGISTDSEPIGEGPKDA